jgi:hypothetical protein
MQYKKLLFYQTLLLPHTKRQTAGEYPRSTYSKCIPACLRPSGSIRTPEPRPSDHMTAIASLPQQGGKLLGKIWKHEGPPLETESLLLLAVRLLWGPQIMWLSQLTHPQREGEPALGPASGNCISKCVCCQGGLKAQTQTLGINSLQGDELLKSVSSETSRLSDTSPSSPTENAEYAALFSPPVLCHIQGSLQGLDACCLWGHILRGWRSKWESTYPTGCKTPCSQQLLPVYKEGKLP